MAKNKLKAELIGYKEELDMTLSYMVNLRKKALKSLSEVPNNQFLNEIEHYTRNIREALQEIEILEEKIEIVERVLKTMEIK